MLRFIETSTGHFVRSDLIAVIQFRRDTSGKRIASVTTTIPTATGTVHYDVHESEAIAELEMLLSDAPKPRPRGVET